MYNTEGYVIETQFAFSSLVPLPPSVVVSFGRSVKDELGAAVQGSVGPDVEQAIPDLNVFVLDADTRRIVQSKAIAVLPAGIDAASESKAVIDKDLDEGAVDEYVHFDRFGHRITAMNSCHLVGLKVPSQRRVGEYPDLGGVGAVQDDGLLRRIIVDVRVLLSTGRGSDRHTCDTCGVLDIQLQFIGITESAGQADVAGVAAHLLSTMRPGVARATAKTRNYIAGWAHAQGACSPCAIGV